ncbi:MAG: cobalamin B12-binding domain-containing protein, partial [Candidatus Methanoperedens sp.]|nr:cobalamin B12-binding domain-containing protein [Candidatus Methanoperedens sp.]
MDILLVNPIIRGSKPPFYFPLGLSYIARMLLNAGHKVEILDINALRLTKEETTDKIKASKFDLVGLTGLVTEYSQIKWLASQFKEFHPDNIIILGGGLATLAPELVLKKLDIDIVVIGEGEETIKDL